MKKTACICLCCLLAVVTPAQTGVSNKGGFYKKKEAPKSQPSAMEYFTPFLTSELAFAESGGNNILDAGEAGSIEVVLRNIGKTPAEECQLMIVQDTPNRDLFIQAIAPIAKIEPGTEKRISISLKASEGIKTAQTKLVLRVAEKNGFDLYPEKIMILPTREYQPPVLAVVDYGIEDQNRNLKIEKFEKVDVTVRVQNKGESAAENVTAKISLGSNVVPLDVLDSYELGTLGSGSYRDVKAIVASNARATEMKLTLTVTEKTGKYGTEKLINLPFDVVQKKADEIIIASLPGKTPVIADAMLSKLDIAENIPAAKSQKPDAVAVIIGNRDYDAAPAVAYALNDAVIMKNYVVQALGYDEANIIYIENAKQSDLAAVFGKERNHKGKLYDFAKKGKSEVFIYYSGHGAPDTETKDAYLVPIDCDPNKVALNGFSMKTLYENLDAFAEEKQPPKMTVVLDACFSGNSSGGSLLKNISPIYITAERAGLKYENSAIYASAAADQVSNWYPEKKQSLFTYFFLKGLKGDADFNSDGTVTTEELHQFVADEVNGVPYWCRRVNPGRSQTPTFIGKNYLLRE